jgi:protein FAM50
VPAVSPMEKFVSATVLSTGAPTVGGLQSLEELRERRLEAERQEKEAPQRKAAAEVAAALRAAAAPVPVPSSSVAGSKRPAVKGALLSFGDDDEDEGAGGGGGGGSRRPAPARPIAAAASSTSSSSSAAAADAAASGATNDTDAPSSSSSSLSLKRARIGKDPGVVTSFLPDADREAALAARRAELTREFAAKVEREKAEQIEVVYSYWDGSGHRRSVTLPKGTSVGKFLERVRLDLLPSFPDLARVSSSDLLYVKEDLIVPHAHTFYELISTRARGKSGPLFQFDVHDDVRLVHDTRVEKDESHPGKVVERRWYDRNKHIFPASRWEVFDPAVKRDEGYTVHGHEAVASGPTKGVK